MRTGEGVTWRTGGTSTTTPGTCSRRWQKRWLAATTPGVLTMHRRSSKIGPSVSVDLSLAAVLVADEAGAVDGRLEGGSIYTPGYVRRLRAQLRGAMRAALVPTTRDALVANALRREDRHGVADAALTGALLGDLARGSSGGSAGSAGKRGSSLRERGGRNEPADAENVAADGALRLVFFRKERARLVLDERQRLGDGVALLARALVAELDLVLTGRRGALRLLRPLPLAIARGSTTVYRGVNSGAPPRELRGEQRRAP